MFPVPMPPRRPPLATAVTQQGRNEVEDASGVDKVRTVAVLVLRVGETVSKVVCPSKRPNALYEALCASVQHVWA